MSTKQCTRCSRTHSNPGAFLLTCADCDKHWHHRCHQPPVSDEELIARIKAFNEGDIDNGIYGWVCRRCGKKRKQPPSSIPDRTEISAATPIPQPSLDRPIDSNSIDDSQVVSTETLPLNRKSVVAGDGDRALPAVVSTPEPLMTLQPEQGVLFETGRTTDLPSVPELLPRLAPSLPHYYLMPYWILSRHTASFDQLRSRTSTSQVSPQPRRSRKPPSTNRLGTVLSPPLIDPLNLSSQNLKQYLPVLRMS